MLATGGLLISIVLLTLAVLVPVFRGSDPPRWTTRGWIGEVVTVALVALLALGFTCLVAGAIDAAQEGGALIDLGLLAVIVLVGIAIWRRLRTWPRPTRLAAASAVAPPSDRAA